MTCCFVENDVLFCWKRRVVLLKTTCCFSHTIGGTEKNKRRVENEDRREGTLESKNEFVKIPIITLSRAYAYARTKQEFYHFCCHKCHRFICKLLWYRVLLYAYGYILTVGVLVSSKFVISNRENTVFPFFLFLHFCQLFFLLPSLVWHLWQQKNNIAVGMRALRIRARKLHPQPAFLMTD